jgi:hypothetical protein
MDGDVIAGTDVFSKTVELVVPTAVKFKLLESERYVGLRKDALDIKLVPFPLLSFH